MKQSIPIFMCEHCNSPLAEDNIKELDIKKFKIFIKEGSKITTDDEPKHINGYYCSTKCLTNKVLETTKEVFNVQRYNI